MISSLAIKTGLASAYNNSSSLLSPEKHASKNTVTEFTSKFGGQGGTASTDTYDTGVEYVNEVDGKINVFLATFFLGVHKDMSEEEAYNLTKLIYDNMDTFYSTSASAKNYRVEEAVFGMSGTPGLKLHPGAIRAHEERGINIPDQYK